MLFFVARDYLHKSAFNSLGLEKNLQLLDITFEFNYPYELILLGMILFGCVFKNKLRLCYSLPQCTKNEFSVKLAFNVKINHVITNIICIVSLSALLFESKSC